jgi:O-antigen ligase
MNPASSSRETGAPDLHRVSQPRSALARALGTRFKVDHVASVTLFCFLCFVMLAPLITVQLSPSEANGEGNALRQIVYVVIFGMACTCTGLARLPLKLTLVPVSVLVFLGWSLLSLTWAIDPGIAMRRLLLTVLIIFSIFLLMDRVGYERTVQLVRITLALTLLANYVSTFGWPTWAIHQATEDDPSIVGAWHGILVQKNFAGSVCALTIVFFALDASRIQFLLRSAVIAMATYFLYRTESKTSEALLVFSLFVGALSKKYSPRYRSLLCLSIALLIAAATLVAYQKWDVVSAPFDSEDALTGRVQIWPVLLDYWHDHWLLGSGFGSFWNIGTPEPITAYASGWVTEIASGHNGYIDLLVQTGLPGLVLAIFATLLAPAWRLISIEGLDPARRSLLIALVWFAVGHNLTESSIFDRDATVHVVLMLAIALLGSQARRGHAHA